MSSSVTIPVAAVTPVPFVRLLLRQTLAEIRIRRRIPAFSVVNLALPVVFYAFFGLPVAQRFFADGRSIGRPRARLVRRLRRRQRHGLPFGIGVANERAMRIDLLLRATPLPPAVHLLAQDPHRAGVRCSRWRCSSASACWWAGRAAAGVWLSVALRLLGGSLPFIGLGFLIGYRDGSNAAPAVANLVYLPLSFASGLFMPLISCPVRAQHRAVAADLSLRSARLERPARPPSRSASACCGSPATRRCS